MPTLLVLIGLTAPSIIYFAFPFGREPSEQYTTILITVNGLAFLGTLFYPLFLKLSKKNNPIPNIKKLIVYLKLFLLIIFILNIYIYSELGFKLAAFDIALRETIYKTANLGWFIYISLSMTSALLIGNLAARNIKLSRTIKALIIINFLMTLGYGMKANALQIILCFATGYLVIKQNLGLNNNPTLYRRIFLSSIGLIVIFWTLSSTRTGAIYSPTEFILLIYYYAIPPFTNFGNILGGDYKSEILFGGILEGFYKIFFIKTNPLSQLNNEDLEYQTWNVWGPLANFYTSGGVFELYLGFFLIGLYIALSFAFIKKKKSIASQMNFAQMLILCATLNNSYYFQSVSPIIAIILCWYLETKFSLNDKSTKTI